MEMNCTIFRENLDQYIDSTLSSEARTAMEKHASSCDECASLLNDSIRLATMCAELNEGLTVPLECQAGWRRAVREEAASRKSARARGWMRALSAVAAVLVLCVAVASQTDMSALFTAGRSDLSETNLAADYDYSGGQRSAPGGMGESGEAYGSTVSFTLQSDGPADDVVSVTESGKSSVVVLRSAVRKIRSDSFDADVSWLEDLASEYGAYFEERRVSGQAETGSRVLQATVRVPSESLDDFLTAMDALGTITLREDYAEDVTDSYTDVSARLAVLRSQLDQLNAMNSTAQSVNDLIAINERATAVMEDIEAYESVLRGWDSRKSYSSVTVTVTEKTQAMPEEPLSLGQRMKEAFGESVDWLRDFGRNAAVFGAALLPRLAVWVPVAAVVILLLRLAFRRKKK